MSSVSDMIRERLLTDIKTRGRLPWNRPLKELMAFNYITLHVYKGVNRWVLPKGEYLTKNQINTYNRSNGTHYMFAVGIKWFPVVYNSEKVLNSVRYENLPTQIQNSYRGCDSSNLGWVDGYFYKCEMSIFLKCKLILKYSSVADRTHFVDENGNCPPSRLETGDANITYEKPEEMLRKYITRSNLKVRNSLNGIYYNPKEDYINVPDLIHFKSTDAYYSALLHECCHSTGHESRLNRKSLCATYSEVIANKSIEGYEEVVAEFATALLCAEANMDAYNPLDDRTLNCLKGEYQNTVTYLQGWISVLENKELDLLKAISEADRAAEYILRIGD